MKQKVVITGGAGFIGSHIAERFVDEEYEVIVIDDLSSGKIENLSHIKDKITFVEGSIFDSALLKNAVQDARFVIHQAAIVSVPASLKDPLHTDHINTDGFLNVLLIAKECEVERVIYASSCAVYGSDPELPKKETDICTTFLSPYAIQKYTCELYGKLFSDSYEIETVGLRYFNVFGERQALSGGYPAVIPIFIKTILEGRQPVIFGDGETTRDFIYVKNIVEANFLACFAKNINGEVFNVGSGRETSLNTLVENIHKNLNTEIKPLYEGFRVGDIKRSVASITKAREKLNYIEKVTFEEGLRKTIEFYKK